MKFFDICIRHLEMIFTTHILAKGTSEIGLAQLLFIYAL